MARKTMHDLGFKIGQVVEDVEGFFGTARVVKVLDTRLHVVSLLGGGLRVYDVAHARQFLRKVK